MDFLFGWAEWAFTKVKNFFFPGDEQHVQAAMQTVSEKIFSSKQAQEWLKSSGWSACENVVASMRNPATREAAIFDAINSFYQCNDNAAKIQERLACHGLNGGTTTRSYLLNSGPGSIGQGKSNHQAMLLVDEGASPPRITLAFRGMNPFSESIGVGVGLAQAAFGNKAEGFQREADLFWQSAGPEVQRIIAEVSARTGAAPEITVAGHSYGADAAARMIPKLAQIMPKTRLHYIGYGGIQSFTRAERDQIQAACTSAVQYIASSDFVKGLGFGYTVGEQRNIPSNAGHADYGPTGNVASLMEALQDMMQRDPKHVEALANKVVADFKRDSTATMNELAALAAQIPRSGTVSQTSVS
ncbi:MAG: hypothetical protein ACKVOE_01355 [Rickettsiales bacterium]